METKPAGKRRARRGGPLRGVLMAIGLVAVVTPVERALASLVGEPPFVLFHIAVGVAAWFGGLVAGTMAIVLSIALAETLVVQPGLFSAPSVAEAVRSLVFLIIAAGIVYGVVVLNRAMRGAATNARRTKRLAARLRNRSNQLEHTARRYRRLQQVAAALLRALTPQQVVDVVIGAGVAAAEASAALLLRVDRGIRVMGSVGVPHSGLQALRGLDIEDEGPLTAALIDGDASWLTDGQALIRYEPDQVEGDDVMSRVPGATALSWAVLPLSVRERQLGALALGFDRAGEFTDEERTFALLFAQQCAQALDRARLYEAERTARVHSQFAERQLGFLAAVTSRLTATFDTDTSLGDVAVVVAANLGDFCAIHVLDETGSPRFVAGAQTRSGHTVRHDGVTDCLPLDIASPIGYPRVLRTGRADLVATLTEESWQRAGRTQARIDQLRSLGLQTMFCAPLQARDRIIGAVTIGSTTRNRPFSLTELALGDELALRLAQALDNAQLYNAALQASKAKSTFLAVMSHELRTPLNAIIGYSDLVLLGVPAAIPEETRHQIERIRRAANHLLHLVDDVLSYARVESGRDRVMPGPVPLDAIVGEAVGLILPLAQEKGIGIRQNGRTGEIVFTDGNKLTQILNNLLVNAIKFTDEGVVEVAVRIEGQEAVVVVTDTGIGIAAEHLDRVFDPFWQAEQSPTRRYGGTGIGLGVARHLARLLGGDLTVLSRMGVGSTFTLRLPRRIPGTDGGPA